MAQTKEQDYFPQKLLPSELVKVLSKTPPEPKKPNEPNSIVPVSKEIPQKPESIKGGALATYLFIGAAIT